MTSTNPLIIKLLKDNETIPTYKTRAQYLALTPKQQQLIFVNDFQILQKWFESEHNTKQEVRIPKKEFAQISQNVLLYCTLLSFRPPAGAEHPSEGKKFFDDTHQALYAEIEQCVVNLLSCDAYNPQLVYAFHLLVVANNVRIPLDKITYRDGIIDTPAFIARAKSLTEEFDGKSND